MHRFDFPKATAFTTLALAACCSVRAQEAPTSATQQSTKPNIIFILTDDVGLANLSCYGSDQFKTPRLDELAKSGTRYTQCYSMPLCGPSRATLMTGRYMFRTGMIGNQSGHVLTPANEVMIPKVLEKAGYATAQIGKWSQLPLEPGDWGFREYFRFQGSGKYWTEKASKYVVNGDKKTLPEGGYAPDAMHDFAVDFIKRHKEEPFFLYYSMAHVHTPIVRTPDSTTNSKDLYADNVAYMDKLVGKLVDELERQKLREKTVLIFVGDNGTAPVANSRATIGGRALSGLKGTLREGGSRVPMIVSCPGTTPAGKVSDDMVDFSDFFPTFAELAGAKLPEGVTIDGHSFAGQVENRPAPKREWVYVELNGKWYARSPQWKLNSAGELFDMKNAPFVETPVSADDTNPEAAASRKQLQAVLEKLNPAAGKQASIPESVTKKLQKRETTGTGEKKSERKGDRKSKRAEKKAKKKSGK